MQFKQQVVSDAINYSRSPLDIATIKQQNDTIKQQSDEIALLKKQLLELQNKDDVIVIQKVTTPKITTPKKTQKDDDDIETKKISMDDMMLKAFTLVIE